MGEALAGVGVDQLAREALNQGEARSFLLDRMALTC